VIRRDGGAGKMAGQKTSNRKTPGKELAIPQ
jgi:hypothetical protein